MMKKEHLLHQLVIINLLMTVIICPFVEILLSNTGEFAFRAESTIVYALEAVLLMYAVLVLTGVLLRHNTIYYMLLFALSMAAYIQGMFLNGKLFLLDGVKDRWSTGLKLSNMFAWCVVFAVVFVLRYKFKGKTDGGIKFISAALICMQLAGAVSLIITNAGDSQIKSRIITDYFGTDGIYGAASDENVMIFVLDTYDTDYMDAVLKKYPDFLSPLKGFTYFPDTVSQYSRTFPSIPYMLTNQLYFYERPYVEYCDDAYKKCDFWDKALQKGYQLYFYEESSEYIGSDLRIKAKNYVAEGHATDARISVKGVWGAMCLTGAYKVLPYAVKDYFSYTAGKINGLVVARRIWDKPRFYVNDAAVYEGLKESGLMMNEDAKAVRFYHFNGAHAPYTMNEKGEEVSEKNGNSLDQYAGCMNMVYEYIYELKRLGLYENATIIITADHGENYVTENLEQATNPILFIKPAGLYENDLVISDACASQNDMLPTLGAILGIEVPEDMGENLLDTQAGCGNRIRYHYYTVVENTKQTKTRTYEIKGSSLDFANWSATDEYKEFIYYD